VKVVKISTNIDNYHHRYPEYTENFNEFEKIFWVFGQELQSLKYLHALYVDSYAPLPKSKYLLEALQHTRNGPEEAGHTLGLYNLISSFAPGTGLASRDAVSLYWRLLFITAVTPTGLINFLKFLTAYYVVSKDIDILLNYNDSSDDKMQRIDKVLPKIVGFIYEWSSQDEIQVGGYYFFPGNLPFMSYAALIGIDQEILTMVNQTELAKALYNQLQEYKDSKLTPTLQIESLNITEAWKNG